MVKKTTEIIEIRPIQIRKATIHIVGDTPLIMHAWSEKAKREMLDNQTKKTKTKAREPKNPVADFIHSMYWLTQMPTEMTENGYYTAIENSARFGFPVTAFKKSAIAAAYRMGWTPDMASLRGVFYIDGDENQLVEIHGTPVMREDMVRVQGKADIRYRGEFRNWSADLTISFNENGKYSLEQIVNIINAGGYFCGVGEWRPERDGQYGMFHVEA